MILQPPVRNWACPSCNTVDRTQRPDPHTQMHPCAGLYGLNVPLVEVQHAGDKPDARHAVIEREDYAGSPLVPRVTAVNTYHGDGSNDCTVYPSTASIILKGT